MTNRLLGVFISFFVLSLSLLPSNSGAIELIPTVTVSVPATSSTGSYTVSWSGTTVGSFDLTLEQAVNSGPFQGIYTGKASSRSFSGRPDGTYRYRISRTTCFFGSCETAYSDWDTIVVSITPVAPSLTGPSSDTDGSYTISWNSVSSATGYQLQERLNSGSWSQIHNASQTSKARSGRSHGTWSYRVRACNGTNCSSWSSIKQVAVTLPPATPGAISGPATSSTGSFSLSWGGSAHATSYTLQRQPNGGSWSTIQNTAATTRAESGLADGSYAYRVRACNSVGCSGWTSNKTVSVLRPPAVPSAISGPASDNDGTFSVSWGSVGSATSYQLQRRLNSGSWAGIQTSSATSRSESGIADGTYGYRVRACNASGCSGFTATKTVTVLRPPAAPSGISGPSSNATGSFSLSWGSVSAASTYELQRSDNGGAFSSIQSSSALTRGESGLAAGVYQYRVRACNSGGCSGFSATKSVSVIVPGPPAVSSPSNDSDGAYTVSWTTVAEAETYQLQRRQDGGSWSDVQTSAATSFGESGRSTGDWSYQVRSCTAGLGCGAYSAPSTTTVLRVPATPSGIVGPSVSDVSFTLSWSSVADAASYELQELAPGGSWANEYTGSSLSAAVTVTEIGTFEYRLRACNASGCSAWSATKSIVVSSPPTPTGPIDGPSGSVTGSFALTWDSSTTATSYRLERRLEGAAWPVTPLQETAATSYTANTLADGDYEFQVSACNLAGCSPPSPIHDVDVLRLQPHTIPAAPAPATYTDPGAIGSSDSVGTTAGEFRVDESGAATYSIPIMTAEGTAGVAPRISLNYSSGAGNGIAGMGWSVGGLSAITRCKQTYDQDRTVLPITWTDTDRFCLDGQRLLLEDPQQTYGAINTVYRTEIDTGARVFIRGSSGGEPDHFEVQRKDGSTSYYGVSPADASNLSAKYGGGAGQTFIWAIREYRDNIGNPIWFDYYNDADGQRIHTIYWAYGSGTYKARLVFEYEDRGDKRTGYVAGVALNAGQRLSTIKSYNNVVNEALIREYKLAYNESIIANDKLSRLTSIEECVGSVCLPKTEFDWRVPAWTPSMNQLSSFSMAESSDLSDFTLADINGDGLMDLVWIEGAAANGVLNFAISDGTSYTQQFFDGGGLEFPLPGGGRKLTAIDYNLDGRHDIAYWSDTASQWRIVRSVPQTDGEWRLARSHIATPINEEEVSFVDVDSNGTADAVWRVNVGLGQLYLSRLERNPAVTNPASPVAYHFATPETIGVPGTVTIGEIRAVVADFNGDGSVGIVVGEDRPQCGDIDVTPPVCIGPQYATLLNIDAINGPTPNRSAYANLNNIGPVTSSEHVRTAGVTSVDINGDGLSDLFYPVFAIDTSAVENSRYVGQFHLAINKGDGSFDVTEIVDQTLDHRDVSRPQFVDWNGDGFPDLMWKSTEGSGTVYVMFWDPELGRLSPRQTATTANNQDTESVYFPDINGDGVPDKLEIDVSTGAGIVTVYTRRNGGTVVNRAANRIEKITNGIGAETAITYEPLSYSDHYERMQVLSSPPVPGVNPVFCIPSDIEDENICVNQTVAATNTGEFYTAINGDWSVPGSPDSLKKTSPVLEVSGPMYVVTDVVGSAPAGIPGSPGAVTTTATSSLSYHYREAKAQAAGRGFLGFEQLKTVDNIDDVETTTRYRQDWPFTGLPIGTVVASAGGHVIDGGATEWEVLGWTQAQRNAVDTSGTASLGPIYVEQTKKHENVYDLVGNGGSAGSVLSSTTTTIAYDDEANAETITTTTVDEASSQTVNTVTTTNTYADQGTVFTLWQGRLTRSVVVADRAEATGNETRTTDFNYYETGPHFGMLRQEIVEPGGGNLMLTTTHFYDDHGNRKGSTVSDGTTTRCTVAQVTGTRVFDASGRYVDSTYDCLGRLTSVVESRSSFGQPTVVATVLDAVNTNSRLRTRIYYGALGREYFRWSDDGSATSRYFSNSAAACPAGSSYAVTETGADGSETQMCYDVLAREVRSLSRGFDGAWDAQDTIYDAKGRIIHKSEPYDHATGAAFWTSILYDLRDRPTRNTRPDGSWTDVSYTGFVKTSVFSFESQERIEQYTPLGELRRVTDDIGGVSSFTYDNLGHLATSTDASSNVTTTEHDKLGRRISMRTPHANPAKGLWTYDFNGFGELVEQTDANGQTSEMTYDGLGRIRTRIDRFPGGSIEANTTWNYDNSPNGLGQLDTVTDARSGYTRAVLYDALGRPDETAVSFDSATYFEKTTFDQYGRVFQYFDASGDGSFTDNGIETRYSSHGHVSAIVDAGYVSGVTRAVYRQVLAMNARGQVVTERLGVKPSGGYAVERNFVYYDDTGRMQDIESKDDTGAWVQDLRYDWNDAGSLTERQDTYYGSGAPNTLTELFGYDDLNRLTSHGATGQASLSVTYDAIGNILTKTGVPGTYSYGADASPYALTGLNGEVYEYDDNGNNTLGGGRQLTYSTFDKPLRIQKGTSVSEFAYDVDRARYRRTDTIAGQVTTTRYVGSVEIIDRPDGTHERKRYIGGVAIETRIYESGSEANRELRYTLKDHLGSLDVIADKDGEIKQKLSFGPWGQRRDASNWQEVDGSNQLIDIMSGFDSRYTTRGFTGHEMLDDVGIVHMNGRIYDPVLGRFLQADNYVQAPENSQSHNRYTYVWNNPLNATDPSGEIVFSLGAMALIASGKITGTFAIAALVGAAAGLDALAAGASFKDALKAGLIAGVSAAAFTQIGSKLEAMKGDFIGGLNPEGFVFKVMSHGTIGGVTSVLQGGNFGHGFASGFFSAGATSFNNPRFIGGYKFSWTRVGVAAAIGGTASKLSGGKFANGAITGAYGEALNGGSRFWGSVRRRANANFEATDYDPIIEQKTTFGGRKNVRGVSVAERVSTSGELTTSVSAESAGFGLSLSRSESGVTSVDVYRGVGASKLGKASLGFGLSSNARFSVSVKLDRGQATTVNRVSISPGAAFSGIGKALSDFDRAFMETVRQESGRRR